MTVSLSPNTQAILLLTAPLIGGRGEPSTDLLTLADYKSLVRFLRERQSEPAALLASDAPELLREIQSFMDRDRLERLLARGFLLSQAVERWQTRAIWVVSRADSGYPRLLKARLKDNAPPILYGCGDAALLDAGGLAVVGSRHVNDRLIKYAEDIGRLAAGAERTLISGGARGIDQAAMRGALEAGGKAAGILADSLERAALNREHRNPLMGGQLVLVSPYDPSAGFNIGNAMQRNKLIYALADFALIVSSDYEKGGTWAGALEQLEKLRLVPVYVRSNGEAERGLKALRQKGALPWPDPVSPEEFLETLAVHARAQSYPPDQTQMSFSIAKENVRQNEAPIEESQTGVPSASPPAAALRTPAEDPFAMVRSLLEQMDTPKTAVEVAAELNVSKRQAKEWLQRLVEEGVLERLSKPTRYRSAAISGRLF